MTQPFFRSRLLFVALPIALLAGAVAFAFFNAQRTLNRARAVAATRHQLPFELLALDPAHLAAINPGFEPIASPATFSAGAFFRGKLYLAGPTGLFVYSSDGALLSAERVGLDLPAAPLTAIVSARLRNASRPQLLIATAGEGLLLVEIDGQNKPSIQQLRPENPDVRDLTALLPLPTGDLLLGTRHHGLLLYNGDSLEHFHADIPGLNSAALQVTALAPDSTGFWVGTRNAGLLRANAGTVERIDSGLPDTQVDSLAVVGTHVYAGTPLGVAEIEATPTTTRIVRILAPGVFAHALAAEPKLLTIGSLDQGIQQLPLDASPRLRAASFASAAATEPIQQFLPTDSALFGITRNSVLRRTGSNWTPVLAPPAAALTDGNISALAFTPDGHLYVGFFDRGLDVLTPTLDRAQHLEDDRLFCVNRLVLDPRRGTIAAATANGLVLFDGAGRPRQTLTRRDGLIADHVTDIAFTPQGMALATPAGITFVDPSGTQSLYAFQGLVNNHIYALAQRESQLVAGTLGGLSVLESESVRRNLTVANSGLKHNWITAIAADPKGFWVGTYGAGIQRLTLDGRFEPMEMDADLIEPASKQQIVVNPNAMLATAHGIYAGTLAQGLLVYSPATGRWSGVTHGLPSRNVTALAERNGQLYIGTENGLVRIAEASIGRRSE